MQLLPGGTVWVPVVEQLPPCNTSHETLAYHVEYTAYTAYLCGVFGVLVFWSSLVVPVLASLVA